MSRLPFRPNTSKAGCLSKIRGGRIAAKGRFPPRIEALIQRRAEVWGVTRSAVIVSAVVYAFGLEEKEG